MAGTSEQPRPHPDAAADGGAWTWDGQTGGYVWWDGQRYTIRATWDGSSWRRSPIENPAPTVRRSAFSLALVPTVIGWSMLGYIVMLIGMSSDVACTAHRGDAYRECIRGDDLTAVRAQGWIMGFAMAAFGLVLAGLARQRPAFRSDTFARRVSVAAGLLVAVSIAGWILGVTGLWAPDRPHPYDPVSVARGSTIMLTGMVVGLLVGLLIGVVIMAIDRPQADGSTSAS